jgi:hypothetical protein
MGRRARRRAREGKGAAPVPVSTSDYADAEGNVLTLRDQLSAGTVRRLEGQRELLGRYRMAGPEERRWVREKLGEHLRARHPEIEL